MRDNLIFDCNSETIYGFLSDLILMFEEDSKNEPDDETLTDALAEARMLQDADDDRYVYKCWYNPMGAFIFEKMLPQKR